MNILYFLVKLICTAIRSWEFRIKIKLFEIHLLFHQFSCLYTLLKGLSIKGVVYKRVVHIISLDHECL